MVHKLFADLITSTTYSLLRDYDKLPEKVMLFPEEGWACAACNSHLILRTPWWSRKYCHVYQIEGTRRHKTVARVLPSRSGEVVVEGTFRGLPDGDFRLVLKSAVTAADQRKGYTMTGSVERGNRRRQRWQTTHLAVTLQLGFT